MTEIDGLQDRLKQHQEAFNEGSAEGGYDKSWPPDGTYQALVRRFDFFEAKKSGDAFLKTVLEIQFEREYKGWEVETIHNLEDAELLKAGWLKTHLKRLGVDVDNMTLADVYPGSPLLASLLDVPVEIAIKTSDRTDDNGEPYRNVYVNKRLGDALGDVVGGPRSGGKIESDVPADTSDLDESPPADTGDQEEIPF